MTADQSHVTKSLAQFVAGSQWDAIPPEVRCEGVRGLLNFVGCGLGGARDEAMDIALTVLAPFFGAPQAIVIGRGERPDALNAAFLNAVSANVLEYDDTHLGTVMHPAAPVASGLFALAELRPVLRDESVSVVIVGTAPTPKETPPMRIYVIGNDGITLCREPPAAVNEGEIVVASNEELHAAQRSGKRLLALWNALPDIEKRRKVGDRGALIDQLWLAIEALPEPQPDAKVPSKQDAVIAMLRRSEGATVDEVASATGWQRHTVRGVFSGRLEKKLRLTLASAKEDRGRVYRIAEPARG